MLTEEQKKEQSRYHLQEIFTVLLGVPNTEDNGMVGDFKDLKEYVYKQNGRIRKLEIGLVGLTSILTGLGILDATIWNKVIGG